MSPSICALPPNQRQEGQETERRDTQRTRPQPERREVHMLYIDGELRALSRGAGWQRRLCEGTRSESTMEGPHLTFSAPQQSYSNGQVWPVTSPHQISFTLSRRPVFPHFWIFFWKHRFCGSKCSGCRKGQCGLPSVGAGVIASALVF